jgi:hypothetical protein
LRKARPALCFSAALLSLWPAPCQGQKPQIALEVTGQCPARVALERLILGFVPQDHVFVDTPRIEVRDGGESYDVTVTSGERVDRRSYDDAERRCDERARFAAVFAVLTLLPPELWPENVGSPAPEPPPAPAPAAGPSAPPTTVVAVRRTPRRARLVRVELGGFVAASPRVIEQPAIVLAGAELRTVIGPGAWRGSLALDVAPETDFSTNGVMGSLSRFSGRAGLRHELGLPYAELSALALLERVRGQGFYRDEQSAALDWGARAEAGLLWPPAAGFGAVLGLHVTLVPWSRGLTAEPRGEVSQLPRLWLGATLGATYEP